MAKSRGTFALPNTLLRREDDFLYHLNITPASDSFVERCQDVKFICIGGKNSRMQDFAEKMYKKLDYPENSEFEDNSEQVIPKNRKLKNISGGGGRFVMFKVGPILSASHGIGSASMSVAIHELLKLCHYAKCSDDLTVIRIGTCGGLGVEPGTVVITKVAYNGALEPYHRHIACGKVNYTESRAICDDTLEKMRESADAQKIPSEIGNTIATDDFYEEQARLDGALCCFNPEEKMEFLQRAHRNHGVRNFEMEATCFYSVCTRANVKYAVIACVALLNRLTGDDTRLPPIEDIKQYEQDVENTVAEFIQRSLKNALK